jgi:hypothetical protein
LHPFPTPYSLTIFHGGDKKIKESLDYYGISLSFGPGYEPKNSYRATKGQDMHERLEWVHGWPSVFLAEKVHSEKI